MDVISDENFVDIKRIDDYNSLNELYLTRLNDMLEKVDELLEKFQEQRSTLLQENEDIQQHLDTMGEGEAEDNFHEHMKAFKFCYIVDQYRQIPPKNEDVVLKESLSMVTANCIGNSRWVNEDIQTFIKTMGAALIKGKCEMLTQRKEKLIGKMILTENSIVKTKPGTPSSSFFNNKRGRKSSKPIKKCPEEENNINQEDTDELIMAINKIEEALGIIKQTKITDTDLELMNLDQDIDWFMLANAVPDKSVKQCQQLWNLYLRPSINKGPWTEKETSKLKMILRKYGGGPNHRFSEKVQDEKCTTLWQNIAKEMGTGRLPYQCLAHYQKTINNCIDREWTECENRKLLRLVGLNKYGTRILWNNIFNQFPDRNCMALQKHYFKHLDPVTRMGKWDGKEDELLINGITKYGIHWAKVARCVPGRNDVQCRERYMNFLNPQIKFGNWTNEEDAKILRWVKMNGFGNWNFLSRMFNDRTDNQVLARCSVLLEMKINVDSREDLQTRLAELEREFTPMYWEVLSEREEKETLSLSQFEDSSLVPLPLNKKTGKIRMKFNRLAKTKSSYQQQPSFRSEIEERGIDHLLTKSSNVFHAPHGDLSTEVRTLVKSLINRVILGEETETRDHDDDKIVNSTMTNKNSRCLSLISNTAVPEETAGFSFVNNRDESLATSSYIAAVDSFKMSGYNPSFNSTKTRGYKQHTITTVGNNDMDDMGNLNNDYDDTVRMEIDHVLAEEYGLEASTSNVWGNESTIFVQTRDQILAKKLGLPFYGEQKIDDNEPFDFAKTDLAIVMNVLDKVKSHDRCRWKTRSKSVIQPMPINIHKRSYKYHNLSNAKFRDVCYRAKHSDFDLIRHYKSLVFKHTYRPSQKLPNKTYSREMPTDPHKEPKFINTLYIEEDRPFTVEDQENPELDNLDTCCDEEQTNQAYDFMYRVIQQIFNNHHRERGITHSKLELYPASGIAIEDDQISKLKDTLFPPCTENLISWANLCYLKSELGLNIGPAVRDIFRETIVEKKPSQEMPRSALLLKYDKEYELPDGSVYVKTKKSRKFIEITKRPSGFDEISDTPPRLSRDYSRKLSNIDITRVNVPPKSADRIEAIYKIKVKRDRADTVVPSPRCNSSSFDRTADETELMRMDCKINNLVGTPNKSFSSVVGFDSKLNGKISLNPYPILSHQELLGKNKNSFFQSAQMQTVMNKLPDEMKPRQTRIFLGKPFPHNLPPLKRLKTTTTTNGTNPTDTENVIICEPDEIEPDKSNDNSNLDDGDDLGQLGISLTSRPIDITHVLQPPTPSNKPDTKPELVFDDQMKNNFHGVPLEKIDLSLRYVKRTPEYQMLKSYMRSMFLYPAVFTKVPIKQKREKLTY